MSEESTLVVSKIKNGTVIDHIPAGRALDILAVLDINGKEGYRMAILMNVESKKLGKKDIIKIEGRLLSVEELNIISLVAPRATINIIEDFAITTKHRVETPNYIEGVLRCPNPTCITNKRGEPIKTKFKTISKDPIKLQCEYCGAIITWNELPKLIIKKR
ncbi:MAG: aspartate carbamoyltransferase regulatory subunit [Ignisphaera sp.]|nr:aspartate carbamoyltransferase regulatory subunit [Ignisphaera sp.]